MNGDTTFGEVTGTPKVKAPKEQRRFMMQHNHGMPIVRRPTPGRNTLCLCGSGKKNKHCCKR